MSNDQHFENLREQELQRDRERVVSQSFAGRDGDGPIEDQFEHEPGHLNRDISDLALLNTNIDEVLEERKNYEQNPDVSAALEAIRELPVREAIDAAD